MKPIPVLVIGVGGLGRGRAEMVKEASGFTLAAVCDIDEGMVQRAGEELGVPASQRFVDSDEACRHSGAELAVIVTPPARHADGIEMAFCAGQHVVCAKPLCDSVDDARRIRDLCRIHPALQFIVDQPARWNEHAESIREAVRSGLIGHVGYITWEFGQAWRFGGWRDEMAEVMLVDLSVHHFDLLRHITGLDAIEVYACSFNPAWSWYRGNPCASAVIRMQGGIQVNYFASWVARGHASWESHVSIVGERGAIYWSTQGNPVVLLGEPEVRRDEVHEEPLRVVTLEHGGFRHTLYEIGSAIREGRPPKHCTIEDNLRTMAMVLGAVKSAGLNQPVQLDALQMY